MAASDALALALQQLVLEPSVGSVTGPMATGEPRLVSVVSARGLLVAVEAGPGSCDAAQPRVRLFEAIVCEV